MSRFARLLPLALTLMAAPAFADHRGDRHDNGRGPREHRQVPELSSHGAAAGLALIAGAGAIVLGRRRRRS